MAELLKKTGECYWRDDEGSLWLAESFIDENGVVSTQDTLVIEITKG